MLQLDCINADKSKLHPMHDGHVIRMSYLFSDKVRVSGTSYMALDCDREFANPSPGLKKRMILSLAKRTPDPAYYTEVKRLYEVIENGKKKVKHENQAMIVARKKIEKLLDQLYADSVADMRNLFTTCGYTGLMPLEEEEAIILWGSSVLHPEMKDPGGGVTYSEILSSKWTEEDELYSFSNSFWEYAAECNVTISTDDEEKDEAGVVLFPLPGMVPLNTFSAAELKTIKQDVFGDRQALRDAIAIWSQQLKSENFSAARFGEYGEYFRQQVRSHLQDLDERIANQYLLQKINDLFRGEVGFQNYLAVASAKTVWDFLEWSGMVPKESMHVFEQNLPAGCNGSKAVLLFLSKSYNHQTTEEVSDKKSLEL